MNPCVELDGLLAERASGDLAPEDQARLDAHLPSCERCRAELASYHDALSLMRAPESSAYRDARVPSTSPRGAGRGPGRGAATAGVREHPDLALSTLAAWKRHRRRRTAGLMLGAGLLSVAAAAALALAPGLFAKRAPNTLEAAAPAAVSEPDVDESVEASALAWRQDEEITSEDVALAALDAAEQP